MTHRNLYHNNECVNCSDTHAHKTNNRIVTFELADRTKNGNGRNLVGVREDETEASAFMCVRVFTFFSDMKAKAASALREMMLILV